MYSNMGGTKNKKEISSTFKVPMLQWIKPINLISKVCKIRVDIRLYDLQGHFEFHITSIQVA